MCAPVTLDFLWQMLAGCGYLPVQVHYARAAQDDTVVRWFGRLASGASP